MENTYLTQEEIDERTAILRRFRALLEEQRNSFKEYLRVLELQAGKIEAGDADAIAAHTKLETKIVGNLANLQKVIAPMEALYREKAASFAGAAGADAGAIPVLKTDLNRLTEKVLERNKQNQELLRAHMAQLKNTSANFTNPYRNSRSVYAHQQYTGSVININL